MHHMKLPNSCMGRDSFAGQNPAKLSCPIQDFVKSGNLYSTKDEGITSHLFKVSPCVHMTIITQAILLSFNECFSEDMIKLELINKTPGFNGLKHFTHNKERNGGRGG